MEKLKNIPKSSGCYLFKDKKGQIIYVGKAKFLPSRVKSYFSNKNHSSKTKMLVENIIDVDFVTTLDENSALVLENDLIKSYKPKYNIKLKDDRSKKWFLTLSSGDFPRLEIKNDTNLDSTPIFEVTAAIHPLVTNAVDNKLSLSHQSNLLFLTGANMAGKSTFIKTIGIVLYLAHIGIGVPAKKLELTLFDGLITNLTIADNIVKGESYFFNEVQRIKNTIEKIIDGKKYFVLIDELFKGTNIQDAMKCSSAVIEGLQNLRNSLFIISTHLYEISDGLKGFDNIQFSYFETAVKEKELIFHYQLKNGVSQDRLGYLILEREGVVDLLKNISKNKY